jgi:hypothetical protein
VGPDHREAEIGDGSPGSARHGAPSGSSRTPPLTPEERRVRRAARKRNGGRGEERGPSLADLVENVWLHVQELGDHMRVLVGVRADRAALELWRKALRLSLASVGAVAIATLLIAAALRFVDGLAGGLTALYAGRAWLGDLTAGVLLIGLLGAGAYAFVARWERNELAKHVEKYERLRRARREG